MKIILLAFLFAGLLMAGCTPTPADTAEEAEPPQEIEVEPGVMEEAGQEKADRSPGYVSWPKEIPAEFPEYTHGDILDYPFYPDSYPNIVPIENTSIEAVEEYIDNALAKGFTLEWEREKMGDEDMSWALNLETEEADFGIILAYFNDFSGSPHYLSITLSRFER
ncbi:MAG: hypothetical protein ACQEP5_04590 [Actinomycetota bacterium]